MADDLTAPRLFVCEGSDSYGPPPPNVPFPEADTAHPSAPPPEPRPNRAQRRAADRGRPTARDRWGIRPVRNSLRDLPKRMQGVGAAWRQR